MQVIVAFLAVGLDVLFDVDSRNDHHHSKKATIDQQVQQVKKAKVDVKFLHKCLDEATEPVLIDQLQEKCSRPHQLLYTQAGVGPCHV